MTKQEAKKIKELCVEVDGLTEDCFYLRLAMDNKISKEAASGAVSRLNSLGQPQKVADAYVKSGKLVNNLDKYGIPCAAWCAE